jgi:hypothetical protein
MAMRLEISNCQFSNWTKVAMITALGLSLSACQSVREATGVAKLAPDEFTVLTKAPLIVPPDYNLRPPQPGAADRNLSLPADMARNALFQQQDAASAAARLGQDYSESERLLLSRSGGSLADPGIRQQIGIDSGQSDQGEDFARGVLFPEGGAPELDAPDVRGTQ